MKAISYQLKSNWKLNLLLVSAYSAYIALNNGLLRYISYTRGTFDVSNPWQNTLQLILLRVSSVSTTLALFIIFAYVIYNAYSVLLTLFTDNEVTIATGALTRKQTVISKIAAAVACFLPLALVSTLLFYVDMVRSPLGAPGGRVLAYVLMLNLVGLVMMILTYMLVATGVLASLKRRTSNKEVAIGALVATVYLTSLYVHRVTPTVTLLWRVSLDNSTPMLANASSITGLIVYAIPCLLFGLLMMRNLRE